MLKTLGNFLPKILKHAKFFLLQSSLADMFPLVNTGVKGMTYLSSKRLMVGGWGCRGGTTLVLRGLLELCWVGVGA